MDNIDKLFGNVLDVANSYGTNKDFIEKAYLKARDLHKNQTRKDGTPYIIHPIEVALILAKLGFDENVIAGGLLHDTIEDCGYQKEQMISDFNQTVFDLVDCVSAIDDAKYILNKDNIYEDMGFIKSSAEEQTFAKLINLGKKNPCGFAIKFADRLHNLLTISTFEYPKQLEKVRETEKWVIPIAKALQSEYFYREIKNECFKIVNKYSGERYFEQYDTYHKSNTQKIIDLDYTLKDLFKGSIVTDVKIMDVKPYKVFEDLQRLYKSIDISKVSQGQIIKVTNYNIYLLFADSTHQKTISHVLNMLQKTNLKVIDAKIGGFTDKMYFQVEDDISNKYNIYVMSESEYNITKVGTLDGQHLDKIDEDNINQMDEDLIRVKTRSNEIKYMAKNSTVLDFAFKIHKDIGFAFKYAIVNDGKTKFPPYTKLNNNDKVEIITDKDSLGNMACNAQLKWLAYVNTELAKKVLIKYFEEKLVDQI